VSLRFAVAGALAIAGLTVTGAPALADAQVGMLSCRSAAGANYVVVSNQTFSCTFTPSTGGPVQHYSASINRVGAQIGVTNEAMLGWAVFAGSSRVGQGALVGNYGGVSGGATVGVGGNANVLVGGYQNAFTLQPLSLEGETGLNVVATITGMEIQSAGPVRHKRHKHH